jgi:hypothetical protein
MLFRAWLKSSHEAVNVVTAFFLFGHTGTCVTRVCKKVTCQASDRPVRLSTARRGANKSSSRTTCERAKLQKSLNDRSNKKRRSWQAQWHTSHAYDSEDRDIQAVISEESQATIRLCAQIRTQAWCWPQLLRTEYSKCVRLPPPVSMRQHASVYVSIRQHTSAYECKRKIKICAASATFLRPLGLQKLPDNSAGISKDTMSSRWSTASAADS